MVRSNLAMADKRRIRKVKQKANIATPKTEIDVEMALRWAWRDELSKRQTSAAEAVWDRIDDFGRHGGIDVDSGGGGAQRYDFGVPDPDAEALERAVAELEPVVIAWARSLDQIAGPLAGLVSVNDFKRQQQPRAPKAGWGKAGDRALRGWFGPGGERPLRDKPRDMLMVGTFRPKTPVTVHAAGASRPDWRDEEPTPGRVLPDNDEMAKKSAEVINAGFKSLIQKLDDDERAERLPQHQEAGTGFKPLQGAALVEHYKTHGFLFQPKPTIRNGDRNVMVEGTVTVDREYSEQAAGGR
jgi:hypothetical protein